MTRRKLLQEAAAALAAAKLARWRALATAVQLEKDFPLHPEAVAWNKHRQRQRIVIHLGRPTSRR